MPDLSDQIEQAASEPQSATVDGRSATAQPIPDLIAADIHLTSKEALDGTNANGGAVSGWRGLRPAIGRSKGGHQ